MAIDMRKTAQTELNVLKSNFNGLKRKDKRKAVKLRENHEAILCCVDKFLVHFEVANAVFDLARKIDDTIDRVRVHSYIIQAEQDREARQKAEKIAENERREKE